MSFSSWVVKNLEKKAISLEDIFQTLKNTKEIETEDSFSKETDRFMFSLNKENDEIELELFERKENVHKIDLKDK